MTRIPVREDLSGIEPYYSPQLPARLRLNTNESPYPPPAGVLAEVTRDLESGGLNRYPDQATSALIEALARHTGWEREGLWAANGSNEVFMHLFLAYGGPGRTSLTFAPTYTLHSLIPKIVGTRTLEVPRNDRHEVDLDGALELIRREGPEIVILCSPNNPTGNLEPVATVEAVLAEAPGIVIVDEAYIDFAPEGSGVRAMLSGRDDLVITRTFSKAWRLAGVRLGYLMASPDLVAELARVRLPYHLSHLTQVFGEAALRYRSEMLATVASIVEQREILSTEMQRLGLRTFPSAANFVLFEAPNAEGVWRSLLDRGVLIRNYASVPGLEGCLRVTAGLPEETEEFLATLREVL